MAIRPGFGWLNVGLLISLTVLAQMQTACAQGRPGMRERGRPQPSGGPPVETTGVIEAVMPPYIKVTTETNQVWILQVDPNAKVNVTGRAKLDFLKPGHYIAFSADVDKRRSVVEEKITKLTIVTPSDLKPVGAFPSQGGAGFSGVPGANIAQGPAAAPAAAKAGGAATERFDIVGQYTGVNKKGSATVMVPNPSFKPALTVEIAEDAEIDLDLTDPKAYVLAKKGDKIEAKGQQVGPTAAKANDILISLSEVLTGAQSGPKKAVSRRSSRGKKADEQEEPAEAEKGESKQPKEKATVEEDKQKEENMEEASEERKAPARRTHRSTHRTKRGEKHEAADEDVPEEKPASRAADRKKKEPEKANEPEAESKPEKPAGKDN